MYEKKLLLLATMSSYCPGKFICHNDSLLLLLLLLSPWPQLLPLAAVVSLLILEFSFFNFSVCTQDQWLSVNPPAFKCHTETAKESSPVNWETTRYIASTVCKKPFLDHLDHNMKGNLTNTPLKNFSHIYYILTAVSLHPQSLIPSTPLP